VVSFPDEWPVGSWPDLAARLDDAGTAARWAGREPALTDVGSIDELPSLVSRERRRDTTDEVLGALVRWAARDGGDDPDAVLVLLHLLRPGAHAVAARLGDRRENLLPTVIGELTCQIRAFGWRRRTHAYAANLLLDTKHALWIEGRWARRCRPVDPHHATWDRPRDDPRWAHIAGDDLDLFDILRWAARTEVAPATDLALLLATEHTPRGGQPSVAAEFDIGIRALNRRRLKTLAALRAAHHRYPAVAR
jgi:hypothetical protein